MTNTISPSTYSDFFRHLTGHPPYPYQDRLAEDPWPQLLDVPTGLGKTAAVVVGWLWRRLVGDRQAPRRLVYCLPMRALVEQTSGVAEHWCEKAAGAFEARGLRTPTVHRLMGGELDESWELQPRRPAVLVGTQDMLLSRALNRGYGMSRYRWPIHFGLLHNDCLWVFDETQLMGVGVETGAQLEGLRERLGTWGGTRSLWMSATLGREQLSTIDHPEPPGGWRVLSLGERDLDDPVAAARFAARKTLAPLEGLRLAKQEWDSYPRRLAERVLDAHRGAGGLTLVIVNQVERAQRVFTELARLADAGNDVPKLGLVHSRFRPPDRGAHEALLLGRGDRVVVATQAVEAGIDVSARTLVTELAPWPSLVQRLGRANRYGEEAEGAQVYWVDIAVSQEDEALVRPYEPDELDRARELLARLAEKGGEAGPQILRELAFDAPSTIRPVLRRKDLIDLFDTTPELMGEDLDVSRFVRDGEDTDVLAYWRDFESQGPDASSPPPGRDELCRVNVGAARSFLVALERRRRKVAGSGGQGAGRAAQTCWTWNSLEGAWEPLLAPSRLRAGQRVLIHPAAGGYDRRLGWTGELDPVVPPQNLTENDTSEGQASMDEDRGTGSGSWVGLSDHLTHVLNAARALSEGLDLPAEWGRALCEAARWHDVGKAHPEFQERLVAPTRHRPELAPPGEGLWAKSKKWLPHVSRRPHLRHELASALAWLASRGETEPTMKQLVAYLIAAHHGKVRLSIRSVPGEAQPSEAERLFARGVWDGDRLLEVELPEVGTVGPFTLDLSPMLLGEGSWLDRTLALRDDPALGPFRLALLEAVLRVADIEASRRESEKGGAL